MRLLYLTPLLSTFGGQERTLTDKANWLVAQGHEVQFVTYEHEGPLVYTLDRRVRHTDIHCHFFSLYRYPVWQRFFKALQLKRLFRQRFQEVMATARPDVIVVPIPNTENFLCDIMKVARQTPVVIESHLARGHQVIRRGLTERWLYLLFNPLRAIGRSRLLIALTEGDASCWQPIANNIRVVPNPLTCYPDEVGRKDGQRRIICTARFAPQKRLDRLIDAFARIADRYPQWCVDIFGDGELHELLQRQIDGYRLQERIRLQAPTHDIYQEYQHSDLFVLSSDFEGFGLVIIEAMACALPVVVTDCPYGPSEIVEDGQTGFLVSMSVDSLASKLDWMLAHDEERRSMGQKARQAAVRYRQEHIMPQWEAAYLSVL